MNWQFAVLAGAITFGGMMALMLALGLLTASPN